VEDALGSGDAFAAAAGAAVVLFTAEVCGLGVASDFWVGAVVGGVGFKTPEI
jgi:hypothetical protein